MFRVQCIVLALLAAGGCVASRGGEFEPELDRKIDEAFARAEQPWAGPPGERTGNVTLVVEKVLVDRRDALQLESAWRYADEHVTVRGGNLARRNGVRIGIALDGFRLALQAAMQQSRNVQVETAMITSLSGTAGSIAVGQDTYVESLRYRAPGGQIVLLERAFVGASLVAVPTVLPGDSVRVRLYPRFTTRDGRTIDVAAMATEVVVANGQPMVIGGLDQASDDVGAVLFSWGRRQQERRVILTVTPHIHGAP